jgi:hypothetical protein
MSYSSSSELELSLSPAWKKRDIFAAWPFVGSES